MSSKYMEVRPREPVLEEARPGESETAKAIREQANEILKQDYLKEVKDYNRRHPAEAFRIKPEYRPKGYNEGEEMSGSGSGGTPGGGNGGGNGQNTDSKLKINDHQLKHIEDKQKRHQVDDAAPLFMKPPDAKFLKKHFHTRHNGVATPEDLNVIANNLKQKHSLTDEQVRDVFFEIAWYCYHNGSSDKTEFKPLSDTKTDIPLEVFARSVKAVTTLRQFCAYYAPLVWNYGHEHDMPPAQWTTKAIPKEFRWCAFDTFSYVESPAAMRVELTIKPTDAERTAGTTRAVIALEADHRQAVNYDPRITRGQVERKTPSLPLIEAPAES